MLSVLLSSILITSITAQECPPGYALDHGPVPTTQKIEWISCGLDDDPKYAGLECGSVKVPLDYTGATPGVLTIPLVRWCADPEEWNGKSIVTNPGGPGASGIQFLKNFGREWFSRGTGEEYNIVSFDPRGVGVTIPYLCEPLELTEPIRPVTNDTVLRNAYTYFHEQGAKCAQGAERNQGTLVGTPFVARDIDAIFQALDEDGLIRFWGFSYGTVLGATLAAMFPEKIDRMVLDGNVNPTAFYHGHHSEGYVDADESFNFFLRSCLAEAGYCTFAQFGNSEQELLANFHEIIDAARTNQYGLTEDHDQSIKGFLWEALDDTMLYLNASDLLSWAYQQIHPSEPMVPNPLEEPSGDDSEPNPASLAIWAVDCGDWDDIPGTMEDWREWLTEFQSKTELFAEQGISYIYQCSAWQLNARESYTGSWTDIQTRTPILFVNSPYDPRTPIESARNASAGFVGSVVLEHRGGGHCSGRSPSNCTIDAVSNYFLTGELPDVSKPCLPNEGPFERAFNRQMGLEKREVNFEYPPTIRQMQQENDHLFKRGGSYTASPDDAAPTPTVTFADHPATCTPISDQTISDEEAQKGLNDFKAACDSFTGDRWLYRLVCNAGG